jgi:hypothetical protein
MNLIIDRVSVLSQKWTCSKECISNNSYIEKQYEINKGTILIILQVLAQPASLMRMIC